MLTDQLDYVVDLDTTAVCGRESQRCSRLGDRGHRQLRRRAYAVSRPPRREGARGQPHPASRATPAWQDDALDAVTSTGACTTR